MRLVGNDDDIVAVAVGLLRLHLLVEFLDQREDVGLVLGKQGVQVMTAGGPARLLVADHAAIGIGLVDLGIEVIPVG